MRISPAARWGLVAALAIFCGLSGWYGTVAGAWHEEISAYPAPGRRLLAEASGDPARRPVVAFEPSCGDPEARALITSRDRPVLSVCIGGRRLPLMVTSYFSGVPYWTAEPLRAVHADDVLRLRRLGLLLGAFTLCLTFFFVRRFSDEGIAVAAVICGASCSAVVYGHGVLIHYELLPWAFLCAAMFATLRAEALVEGARARTAWMALAAACVSFSVASNFKALFLIAPLALLLVRVRARIPRVPGAARAVVAVCAIMPLVPYVVLFATSRGGGGFVEQVSQRMRSIFHARLDGLLSELGNLLTHWTDIGAFGDALGGTQAAPNYLALGLAAAALVWGIVALVRTVRARTLGGNDFVGAVSAALIVPYILVAWLLYDQHPAANYQPLYGVFGPAIGATVVLAARAIAARLRLNHVIVTIVLVGTAAGSLAYNSVRRGSPARTFANSVNIDAQRAAAGYLRTHRELPIVTTTYNLTGVLDSLSDGEVRTIAGHVYFSSCGSGGDRRDSESDPRAEAGLERCWQALLASPRIVPLRVVVPHRATRIDEPAARFLLPSLQRAARASGRRVTHERSFHTGLGVPVIDLYVVR